MMPTNDTQLSFGRYLQSCRKTKNLKLELIADELKIGRGVLAAIESEDLSRMPDPVFAKGFLRGYARIVNADEHRIIQDYLQRLDHADNSRQSTITQAKDNDLFWRRLTLSATVVLIVIILTVIVLFRSDDSPPEKPAEDTLVSDALTVGESAADMATSAPNTLSSNTAPEVIRLSIITVQETWLKVIIDNKNAKEYTLKPGDNLELEASDKYNLLIGNAAGVKLFANRIPIDLPGGKGKVAHVEIP